MSHRALPLLGLLLSLCLALPAALLAGGSTSWSYSNYNNGSYVPLSGSFTESIPFTDVYRSRVDFQFDSNNRSSILDYNNGGDNPGTTCDNKNAYVTVDMTAVPDNSERLDAYTIITNLPDPKTDLENDCCFSSYNEETEVVALGTVASSTGYYMASYWDDYRTGFTSDRGQIQVQFAMSNQGFSDYNNCVTSGDVQIINRYLGCKGCL